MRASTNFTTSITVAGIELDRDMRLVKRGGRLLRIGEVEFTLLDLLISNPGLLFTRERLIALLWGADAVIDKKTVDVKIGRLKKALTLGRAPNPVRSVRGKGYRFSESADREYARWLARGPESCEDPEGLQRSATVLATFTDGARLPLHA